MRSSRDSVRALMASANADLRLVVGPGRLKNRAVSVRAGDHVRGGCAANRLARRLVGRLRPRPSLGREHLVQALKAAGLSSAIDVPYKRAQKDFSAEVAASG